MKSVKAKLTLKFDYPINAYVLVMGGYLPLSLAFSYILLIDKNILGVLSATSGKSKRSDSKANEWWLSFLNKSSCAINPVLCAMEGSEQTPPTYADFRASFDEACSYIQLHLPNASLVNFSEQAYVAAYEILEDMNERYINERDFLIKVSPLIAQRNSFSKARKVEDKIFDISYECGLDYFSLPLIAAFSCLYESRRGDEPSIGRSILKPSKKYGVKHAHNALSDLRALQLLASGNGLNMEELAFCTRDKPLAAFWCSLKFERGIWNSGEDVSINLKLDNQLFPMLSDTQMDQFYKRMVEYASNNQHQTTT